MAENKSGRKGETRLITNDKKPKKKLKLIFRYFSLVPHKTVFSFLFFVSGKKKPADSAFTCLLHRWLLLFYSSFCAASASQRKFDWGNTQTI